MSTYLRNVRTASAVSLLLAGSLAAQAPLPQGKSPDTTFPRARAPWFEDLSNSTGTLFEHEDSAYSYAMGSGVAWIDIENDGDEDLVVVSAEGNSEVLRRDGLDFTDVTASSGIFVFHGNSPIGIIAADYDQDGLTDLYYCNTGHNSLFRNLGGTFQDVAQSLNASGGDAWSASASFADFDVDGDLDIYVGNYIRQLQFPYHYGEPNVLLENRELTTFPQFIDVAPTLGVDNVGVFGPSLPGYYYTSPEGEDTAGCTLSTCTLDYDEDGDPDLMVGNDFGQWIVSNAFYRNDATHGQMAFTDITSAIGFDTRPHYNMGIVPADYDHDGDWDFYHSNLGDNLLLRNDGGQLVDVTYSAGPVDGQNLQGDLLLSSWCMAFQDFNNDGWEDLLVVNGYIPASDFIDNDTRSPNHMWLNQADGTFRQIPELLSGMDDRGAGRGMAIVDLESDGLLDFYVQNNGADYVAAPQDRSRLFRNTGTYAPGQWLELDVAGRFSNGEGFGTRVDAHVGSTLLKRQVLCDPVFISNSTRMVHFGLGDAQMVDRLELTWPSGIEQVLIDVPAGQRMGVLEPAVTLETVEPILYQGGALVMGTTIMNRDAVAQAADVQFKLTRKDTGAELLTKSIGGGLAPGQERLVLVQETMTAGEYAALQGTEVELRVYVTNTGSEDAELDVQLLP
ncbi:MAG: CRTAC1 family protein [Planctomycetota bacterium]